MHVVIGFLLMSAITTSVLLVMGMGLLQSSWDLATSWFDYQAQEIQRFEGRIKRTEDLPVTAVNLVQLNWKNNGDAPLAQFADWDVILEIDEGSGIEILPLTYTASTTPGSNQWAIQGIYQDAGSLTPEIAGPGILNPGEEMVVLLNPAPAVTTNTFHRATMVTAGGYTANVVFYAVDPNLFFHTETSVISTTTYLQLKNGDTADGVATTTSAVFAPGQTGRVRPALHDGKFVYPLASTSAFAASTWDVTYRVKSNGGGFTWFVIAHDISLSTTGSWQDIDLSPYVPAGTTGAIVEVVNSGFSSSYSGVVRGKEDTRDYMSNAAYEETEAETHRLQIVKVDSNRRIQGYVGHTSIDFKLIGYTTGSDPSYFTTPPDVTPGTTGSWTTVDVSSHVDSGADGVLLFIDSISSNDQDYAIREIGSSFSITNRKLEGYGNTMQVVGIDASDQFDAYVETTDVKIYLIGQTKGSVGYYVNDISVSDPPLGTWYKLDADDYSVPAAANGLFLRIVNESTGSWKINLAHGDSTNNWNGDVGGLTHFQAGGGLNSDNVWSEYMENTSIGVNIAAYTVSNTIDAHVDIDVLVRQADGSVRTTLATDVANTATISNNDWQSLTGSFAFPGYVVVDGTDYLEIDLFAEVTSNPSGMQLSVDFDLDDPALPPDNQTHVYQQFP